MEKEKYSRKSIRLEGYDYGTNGAYFLTICSYKRERTFSEICNGEVMLSELGKIVLEEWENTARLRDYITATEFVVMPNHVHGILFIHKDSEEPDHLPAKGYDLYFPEGYRNKFGPQCHNISSVVRGFKSAVTQGARRIGITGPVWQPRFYEHIIRNQTEMKRIAEYIRENPFNWETDEENM